MSEALRARVEEVFLEALALPETDRAAWARRMCDGEPEVLAEVLSLLSFAEGADSYLAALAARSGAPLGDRTKLTEEEDTGARRLGRYRLLREIGRGGMGAVYLAERADGEFNRQVAVKVLRRGLDTDDVLARFRAERQILASLEHPYIARLFDGGATPGGRPYLVMELVDGLPITTYCDRHHLTVEERLRLLVKVARAVEHAHGKLIAHRDIKPSNILVKPDGTPKLLDFGIAKLLDDTEVAGQGPLTRTGLRLMTPQYASPEQLRGEPVTTTSDAYQLGVLAYQLLVGRRPYPVAGHKAGEIESIIEGEHRLSPTAALLDGSKTTSTHGSGDEGRDELAPEEVARLRGTDVRGLRARLRGDLDIILHKAVQADPDERYASAGELADDIDLHLSGLPILARAPSVRYRAGKFARRHRLGVALATLALAAAATGAAWESWRSAKVSAERERSSFEAEVERARFGAEQAGAVPSPWGSGRAMAINDSGVVTGAIRNEWGYQQAVRWVVASGGTVAGPYTFDARHLPDTIVAWGWFASVATGINSRGHAVGYEELEAGRRPLLFVEGEAELLSRPPGAIDTWAEDINDSGLVVGAATFPGSAQPIRRGLVWFDPRNSSEPPVLLPTLPGEDGNTGRWISDAGLIGGYGSDTGTLVFWRVGPDRSISEAELIGTGRALAMNESGIAVGDFGDLRDAGSPLRPFFRPAGAEKVELELLGGHRQGGAWALDSPPDGEAVTVVGHSAPGPNGSGGPARAVSWTVRPDGTVEGPVALEPVDGYTESWAAGVDAHRRIVGYSYTPLESAPFTMPTLWIPLPEGGGHVATSLGAFGPGPSASLVYSCAGGACRFADTSRRGSGLIVRRSWQSGAREFGVDDEASFSFTSPGVHAVTLEVLDVNGRRDQARVELQCARRLLTGVHCR